MKLFDFDIRTMLLLLFWGNLACTAILLAYQGRGPARRHLLRFSAAKVIQAVAWLLLAQRGIASDLASAYVGNALLFAGFFCEASAITGVFHRARWLVVMQGALAAAGIAVFWGVARTPGSWVAVASLIAALQFVPVVVVMFRSGLRSVLARLVALLYGIFILAMLARTWLGFSATVALLVPGLIQSLAFLAVTVVMMLGVVAFILVLKQQQDAVLAESEERYRVLVETANDAVIIIQDATVAFCNDRLPAMLDRPRGEILGRSFADMVSPEDRDRVLGNYMARLSGEADPPTYDIRIVDRGGRRIWVLVSASRILHQGRPAVMAFLTDISDRVRREAERETLIAELTRALQDKKVLSGLLPICASCKKIRDDKGYWTQIESYITSHAAVEFSHGLCPDCARKYDPDLVPGTDGTG